MCLPRRDCGGSPVMQTVMSVCCCEFLCTDWRTSRPLATDSRLYLASEKPIPAPARRPMQGDLSRAGGSGHTGKDAAWWLRVMWPHGCSGRAGYKKTAIRLRVEGDDRRFEQHDAAAQQAGLLCAAKSFTGCVLQVRRCSWTCFCWGAWSQAASRAPRHALRWAAPEGLRRRAE